MSLQEVSLRARVAWLVRQPLISNAGYLLGMSVLPGFLGFVFWAIASRLYPPAAIGTSAAVISAVTLVAGISQLGIGTSLVRFLPESQSPRHLLSSAYTLSIMLALFIGSIYLAGLSFWSPALIVIVNNGLYVAGFLTFVIVTTLGSVVRDTFVARRRAHYALIHTIIVNIARLILIVLLAYLGIAGLVGSVAIGFGLALGISLWCFIPRVEPGYRFFAALSLPELALIIPYSMGNYIAGLLIQIAPTILPLIILNVLGPVSSAHAYVALMIGSLLASPGIALATSAFAEGANSSKSATSTLAKATIIGLIVSVPIAIVFSIAAPWCLLLFGPSYVEEGTGLLRWLVMGVPFVVLSQFYFTYLRLKKQVRRLILMSSIVMVMTLVISIIMMPRYGIVTNGIGLFIGYGLVIIINSGNIFRKQVLKKAFIEIISYSRD